MHKTKSGNSFLGHPIYQILKKWQTHMMIPKYKKNHILKVNIFDVHRSQGVKT